MVNECHSTPSSEYFGFYFISLKIGKKYNLFEFCFAEYFFFTEIVDGNICIHLN